MASASTWERIERRKLDQEQPWELDGEVMGPARQLTVLAQPGSLLLRMPPGSV